MRVSRTCTLHIVSGWGSSFFFFQAEDGIRDYKVTGVQTCALPISGSRSCFRPRAPWSRRARIHRARRLPATNRGTPEIGRASCRERVSISVVAVSLKKKKQSGRMKVMRDEPIELKQSVNMSQESYL